jgi:hypothetical protein
LGVSSKQYAKFSGDFDLGKFDKVQTNNENEFLNKNINSPEGHKTKEFYGT